MLLLSSPQQQKVASSLTTSCSDGRFLFPLVCPSGWSSSCGLGQLQEQHEPACILGDIKERYWERRAGARWAALTALCASPDCVCLCGLLLELSRHKQNLGSDNVRFASLFVLSCVTCCPSTGGNLKNLPCVFVSRALVDLWDPTQLGGGLLKHFIFPGLVRCYF